MKSPWHSIASRFSSRTKRRRRPVSPSNQPDRRMVSLAGEPLESRLLLAGHIGGDLVQARTPFEMFNLSSALFIENQGQWPDDAVRYLHQGNGANVAMTDAGPVFQVFRPGADTPLQVDGDDLTAFGQETPSLPVEMRQFSVSFVGAQVSAPLGLERVETTFNYQLNDASTWRSDVRAFEVVAYEDLYPGIDLHTWGQRSNLKYEFHVAPGVAWEPIQIAYEGIQGLSIAADGSLVLALGDDWDPVIDAAPYVYQELNGERIEIESRYVLLNDRAYTFELGSYDTDYELVIDPELAWGTYLGGIGSDYGHGIAQDRSENVLVAGWTQSAAWVTGGYDTTHSGGWNIFVAKLSSSGTHLWSTYLGVGGLSSNVPWTDLRVRNSIDIAVDSNDSVLITGATNGTGQVSGGYDATYGGGTADAFVVKLSALGTHLWSTYLGGAGEDYGTGIAVDENDNVLVVGTTESSGWVSGGYDIIRNSRDGFVAKLSDSGTHLWSTYLGGSNNDFGEGIAVDRDGNVLVVGQTFSSSWISGGFDTTYGGNNDAS